MNLNEQFEFLNFWISKERGVFFTIGELTNLYNAHQFSLFEDLQPKYATSQRIKDALSPFRETYNFTTAVSGIIIVPQALNYVSLLDIQIYYLISNTTVYYPIDLINEDTRANRLNSQIDPVTVTSPVGEQVGQQSFRLYPVNPNGYNGTVTFLRKPRDVVFGYNVISGSVIVYNPSTSVQSEWGLNWTNVILVKILSSLGINLTNDQVMNYAELKTQANYNGINMV